MSKLGIPNITKLEESVRLSLEEDIGIGDITGELTSKRILNMQRRVYFVWIKMV